MPQSVRFGQASDQFDEGYESRGALRDRNRERGQNDSYTRVTQQPDDMEIAPGGASGAARKRNDAAEGNQDTEAALRYEDHAALRMQAKREGLYKKADYVTQEDKPETATAEYNAWRNKYIQRSLAANIDAHATDHSTIMTNPDHAKKALAYDVAVGACDVPEEELHKLRIAADWRFVDGLGKENPHVIFPEYFQRGLFDEVSPLKWSKSGVGAMPPKIIDERKSKPLAEPKQHGSQHPDLGKH